MPGDRMDDLLNGLSGDARAARRALVDDLLDRGCAPRTIRAAHEAGRLSLLPLELRLGEEGKRSLEDVAAAHGVSPDDLAATRRALGLPVEREQPVYGDALDDHATRLASALGAGVPLEALVAINRVIGRSTAAVASASRDVLLELLSSQAVEGRGLAAAQAAEALAPQLEQVLTYALREHIRELVRRDASETLVAAGAGHAREVSIAFVDMVGFTRLSREMTPDQVSRMAGELEALAGDSLRPGVSVVKTIGDEVMLASPDPEPLLDTVLDLLVAAEEHPGTPPLRAGAACGPAIQRGGDWYGQTVNLASRLTSLADPGALAADAGLRDRVPSAEWKAEGPHEVRGIDEPVEVHTTTRAGSPESA